MDNDSDGSSSALSAAVAYFLTRFAGVVGGILLIGAGLLYAKQESLLYFPEIGGVPRRPADNPHRLRSPEEQRILEYEDHYITCPKDGVTIHAWWCLKGSKALLPTILFFHGNAGNIGLRLPNARQMMHNLEANILMVEYRGYGNSDSVAPTEAGLKLDAETALAFVRDQVGDKVPVYVFGRSLGGAVAIDVACRTSLRLDGVIVENTFTSISDMVDQLMPFLTPIKPFVLKIGWNSKKLLTETEPSRLQKLRFLFLAGAKDELVPHSQMLDLHRLVPNGRLHIIDNGTHNESWMQGGPAYWDAFRSFVHPDASPLPPSIDFPSSPDPEASSIPTMPNDFQGMVEEAAGSSHKKEL